MADYILEMKNITKLYPGVKALDNVISKSKEERFMHWSVKMVPENQRL